MFEKFEYFYLEKMIVKFKRLSMFKKIWDYIDCFFCFWCVLFYLFDVKDISFYMFLLGGFGGLVFFL